MTIALKYAAIYKPKRTQKLSVHLHRILALCPMWVILFVCFVFKFSVLYTKP